MLFWFDDEQDLDQELESEFINLAKDNVIVSRSRAEPGGKANEKKLDPL